MIQRRGKKKSVHYIFFFRLIRKALLHIFSDDFNIDKLLQAIIAASLSREVRIMNARVKGEQRDSDQTVTRCEGRLRLAELAKHSVDRVEGRVDLFSDLSWSSKIAVSASWYSDGSDDDVDRPLRGIVCKQQRNVVNHLCTCEHDLPRHEDQKHNFGLDHTVDETREQLDHEMSSLPGQNLTHRGTPTSGS